MEKQTISALETILNWKHRFSILLCLSLPIALLHAQKLPDVRVEQKAVTEENLFIEANRARILGDYDKAEAKLNVLLSRYGKKAVFYYELARTYEEVGNAKKAIETNQLAIKAEPNNEHYWEYDARMNIDLENDENVIIAYTKLSELFPNRYHYLENIAFHQLRSDNPQAALKTLNKLERRAGVNFETTRQKHLIYDELGDHKLAASELDAFLNAFPTDSRMATIAASYALNNNDEKKAISYYEAILQHDPNHAIAKGALLQLAKGNTSSKSDQLKAYIENRTISLDDKIMQLIPILVDFQDGKSAFTIEEIEGLASNLTTQYGKSDKTSALQGDIYSMQNKLPEAATAYIHSIEFNDGNYLVWEQLLYVLSDLKDGKRLKSFADDAMDLYPNKSLPPAFLALGFAFENRFDQATDYIKQARIVSGKNKNLVAKIEHIEGLIQQLKSQ